MFRRVNVIYPSLFGEVSSPWDEELKIAKELGYKVWMVDEETLKVPGNIGGAAVLYRGWMLSNADYSKFQENVFEKDAGMLVFDRHFRFANSMRVWLDIVGQDRTIETFVVEDFSTLPDFFRNGESWFVKDDLKSLGADKSIANSAQEALDIYDRIQKNRDFEIEDNCICLRRVVPLENEQRFFSFRGRVLGNTEGVDPSRLSLVQEVAADLSKSLELDLVSIDIATSQGRDVVVEIGDFQVSDMDKEGNLDNIRAIYSDLKEGLERYYD